MKRLLCLFVIVIICGSNIACAQNAPSKDGVPEAFYLEMQQKIVSGSAAVAVHDLQRSLKLHPNNVRLLNLFGLAFTAQKMLEEADAQFEAAIRLDPNFSAAIRNLAINESVLGQRDASIENFERVLSLKQNDPVANAYIGSDAFIHFGCERARNHLALVGGLAQDPLIAMEVSVCDVVRKKNASDTQHQEVPSSVSLEQVPSPFVLRAALELAKNSFYPDAIRFLRALPADELMVPDVTYDLALCLINDHQSTEAAHVLESYLSAHPHTALLLSLAGEAYSDMGETQRAIDSLREAIALEPKVEDHYIDLADLCTRFNAFDVGILVVNVGITNLPNSDRLYLERGVLEAMKNDFDSANRDFGKSQELAPQKSTAGLAQGVRLMNAGNISEAIKELRAKADADPNNAVLQYMLAEATLQNGATPGSKEFSTVRNALEKAIALDPSYEPPLVELARVYVQGMEIDKAHALLKRATELNPNDSSAFSQLAIVAHKLGLNAELKDAIARLSALNDAQRNDRHQFQISAGSQQ